jgi:inactivated superfamily I helicase
VDLTEIEQTAFDVSKLRMPKFIYNPQDPMAGTRPGEKIERLESYILDVAYARGDAEQARLYAYAAVRRLTEKWDHLEGWEVHFGEDPAKAAKATQPQIKEAKRLLDPETFDGIEHGTYLVKRLSEQIKRLEKDEEVASRAYTLISNA